MRQLFIVPIVLLCSQFVFGQDTPLEKKGVVSYLSSQHIYVKFASTKDIDNGDTLFSKRADQLTPALVVEQKSSISTVCRSLTKEPFTKGDEVYHRRLAIVEAEPEMISSDSLAKDLVVLPKEDRPTPLLVQDEAYEQKIRGRVSVGSYGNISERSTRHQMRYTFSMQGDHLRDSRFSVNSYVTFRHTLNEWKEVRRNFGNALKVYNLAVKYDIDAGSSVSLGRQINPRISSMGAIDGLQYERGLGKFKLGLIAGTRPNLQDYGLNLHMLQAGAYLTLQSDPNKNDQQTTAGLIEQRNHGKIDRRFLYFQHAGTPAKNLSLFGSMELDLYKNFNETPSNTLSLTNLFVSVRYRLSKLFTGTLSYDNRKNIIYYESYKNYIDSLIENETRQGIRFNGLARLSRYMTWGMGMSTRFQPGKKNVSRNLNTYINYSKLPVLDLSASLSINYLQTTYLTSSSYGLRLYRDFISGKLSGDISLRMIKYQYKNLDYDTRQYVGGIGLSYRLSRNLGFYLYYEGTIDKLSGTYHRINSKIIKRF